MNYYIQGDAANADKIKVAFEKLGMSDLSGYNFGNGHSLFYTYDCGGSKVIAISCVSLHVADIIKTHPDYRELELPVEPKFKSRDWVVRKDGKPFCSGNYAEQITLIGVDARGKHMFLSSSTWVDEDEDVIRLWTIQDAKGGDVLVDEDTNTIGIFGEIYGICWHSKIYCSNYNTISTVYHQGGSHEIKFTKPATKEQRDLLFAKMREAGYEWDAGKKELRKTKPHYDISNFKPFDRVLVRCGNDEEWMIEFYCKCDTLVHTAPHRDYPFRGIGDSYSQCIPYEGNEHLLGTTDMCDEEFINW